MAMTPERAPTARELLAFYLEAGVDCALSDEPVNWLSDDAAAAEQPAAKPVQFRTANAAPPPQKILAEPAPPPDAAIASAREIAPTAASLQELRTLLEGFDGCALKNDRDATGVRRWKSASENHVCRRSARARRRSRRPAVCRTLRQTARPDDGLHRPRPDQRLYRQHHSMAAARKPRSLAAGNPDLPALHSAADRARRIPTFWYASASHHHRPCST